MPLSACSRLVGYNLESPDAGSKIMEDLIEELFAEVGYRCEEWVGVQNSQARLGIFGNNHRPELKMVFCVELSRNILKCDLLLPVSSPASSPRCPTKPEHAAPRT